MRIVIIGNPISSGGNAEKRVSELETCLKDRGHEVSSYLTRYAGDARENIAQISEGADRIVIIGGDGTVNEIVNGIPDGFSVPLCHWPMGNANLMAQDLNLPKKLKSVVDLIENGRVMEADAGTMNGEKFIMLSGVGFDARVTEEVKKVRNGKVSNATYVRPIIRALKDHSKSRFTVQVDDQPQVEGAIVLVCNVKNYAGICEIAKEAGPDTGSLDVIVFPNDTFSAFIKYLITAMITRVTCLKGVHYLKGTHIRITSENPIPVELDGDFNGRHNEVDILLHKGCVPVLVPPSLHRR